MANCRLRSDVVIVCSIRAVAVHEFRMLLLLMATLATDETNTSDGAALMICARVVRSEHAPADVKRDAASAPEARIVTGTSNLTRGGVETDADALGVEEMTRVDAVAVPVGEPLTDATGVTLDEG